MSTTPYQPIAETTRSGRPESLHHGAVVGIAADGSVAFAVGDADLPIYPRSSLKPMQATAMVRAGLELPDELLALVCASHDGTALHTGAAARILAGAGLDEHALGNTVDYPLDPATAEEVIRSGGRRSAIQMNCSGKHAGMLATCVARGWSTDASYLDEHHPLQQAITDTLDELAGGVEHIGLDGCGAPSHMLTLSGLARAFAAIASGAAGPAGDAVHRAMTSHPVMVGGDTRDVTRIMQGIPGLMAKDGAEGVYAAALPDGRAVAMKVADGANRARPVVMRAALERLGIDVDGVDPATWRIEMLGHGRPVGEVRALPFPT